MMKKYIYWLLLAIFLCALQSAAIPVLAADQQSCESIGYIIQVNTPLPMTLALSDTESPVQEISAELGLYAIQDPALVEALQAEGLVEHVEPDYIVELFDTETTAPAETDALELWHLDMLDTARGDTLGCYGQGVRVAVIDSGCAGHAELESALLPGWNYLTKTDDVTDNIGHGTFVSGLIAAADDGVGVIGAAPEARIVPLKCFDNGVTTRVSTLTAALYDAVDEFDCRVINMSFGIKSYSETLDKAICYAVDHGAVCVASAGNLGTSSLYYPAALPNVISVGAVGSDRTVASFSQRNDALTVVAPGKELLSTTADGNYATKSGTSFSAPLISALCARMLSADASLAPQDIQHFLTASATDLGEEGYDTSYGHGLASLSGAMSRLMTSTDCFLSPFRVTESSLQISLCNNTEDYIAGQCLITQYQDGLMKDLVWQNIRLAPGEATTVEVPWMDHTVKCAFWPNLDNISPITPYRECEVTV